MSSGACQLEHLMMLLWCPYADAAAIGCSFAPPDICTWTLTNTVARCMRAHSCLKQVVAEMRLMCTSSCLQQPRYNSQVKFNLGIMPNDAIAEDRAFNTTSLTNATAGGVPCVGTMPRHG